MMSNERKSHTKSILESYFIKQDVDKENYLIQVPLSYNGESSDFSRASNELKYYQDVINFVKEIGEGLQDLSKDNVSKEVDHFKKRFENFIKLGKKVNDIISENPSEELTISKIIEKGGEEINTKEKGKENRASDDENHRAHLVSVKVKADAMKNNNDDLREFLRRTEDIKKEYNLKIGKNVDNFQQDPINWEMLIKIFQNEKTIGNLVQKYIKHVDIYKNETLIKDIENKKKIVGKLESRIHVEQDERKHVTYNKAFKPGDFDLKSCLDKFYNDIKEINVNNSSKTSKKVNGRVENLKKINCIEIEHVLKWSIIRLKNEISAIKKMIKVIEESNKKIEKKYKNGVPTSSSSKDIRRYLQKSKSKDSRQ